LGDSSAVRTGDQVYVGSNPKGLEGSFTSGIVSGIRRSERPFKTVSGETGYQVLDRAAEYVLGTKREGIAANEIVLLQIDAAVSSGSSGGVVVNSKAEAVGIVRSSLIAGQHLNFAIPSNVLKLLSLRFNHPIQLAGACAYRDIDRRKLKGPVKSVTVKSRYRKVENGRLVESGPHVTGISVFDRDGNEVESHYYSVKGEFITKFIWTFDEARLKTYAKKVDSTGIVEETEKNFEEGIRAKLYSRSFSSKLDLRNGDSQVFDSRGNMTVWYLSGTKQVYEYDDGGLEIEKVQWRNGQAEIRTRYRYKVDSFGNWIQKNEYSNFPTSTSIAVNPKEWIEGNVEYREITYYESE